MVSADLNLVRRVLPHVFALISGVAAYLSLGFLPGREETGPLGVAATFALVGVPVLGAVFGSLIAGRRNFRPVLRPYLLATLWMWGLMVALTAVDFALGGRGRIPNDIPAGGVLAPLLYLGITIVSFWPWFIVPTAQIVHTIRTQTDTSGHASLRDEAHNDRYGS